jgi:hypothetical protein
MATDAQDTTTNPLTALQGYLLWGNDPNVNQTIRQRIALQMMASSKRAAPKNIGEGLTAIGDSLGEIGMARRLEQGDLAQQAAAKAAVGNLYGPRVAEGDTDAAPPVKTASAPPADVVPDVQTPPVAPPAQVATAPMPPVAPVPPAPVAPPAPAAPAPLPPAETAPAAFGDRFDAAFPGGQSQSIQGPTDARPGQPVPVHPSVRLDRITQLLAGRGAAGGPQPNPTLAPPGGGSPSTPVPAPGGQPDPRLALAAPQGGTLSDVQQAPILPPQLNRPPPIVPQQVAQNQPAPNFGYVMPAPQPPMPKPPTPYSEAERKATTLILQNPNNPYIAQQLAPLLAQEKAKRDLIDSQNAKQYESDILQHRTMIEKRQEQIATQAKRIQEGQKGEQELAKPNTIKTETGEDLQLDQATGKWVPLPRGGPPTDLSVPPNVKLSETQQKALTYHQWAQQADDVMKGKDMMLANGLGQEMTGKIPFVGNKWQGEEYRRAKDAANAFVLAFMRSTSGAAYGEKERLDHANAMIPRYGDSPAQLADKAAQRRSFIAAEQAGLPQQLKDHLNYKRTTEQATNQRGQEAVDIEMQGVKPAGIGDTKINKRTGVKRVWDGEHWRAY